MKSKSVRDRKALINSVNQRIKHIAEVATLGDGPFYLVTTKKSILTSKDVEKSLKTLPKDHQLITASENITKEATQLVQSLSGVVLAERDYHWTDESATILNS
jgi:hypothetical protein